MERRVFSRETLILMEGAECVGESSHVANDLNQNEAEIKKKKSPIFMLEQLWRLCKSCLHKL